MPILTKRFRTDIRIGMAGPIEVDAFKKYLHTQSYASGRGLGLGGPSVNRLACGLLAHGCILDLFSLERRAIESLHLKGDQLSIDLGPFRRGRYRSIDVFRVERRFLKNTIRRRQPVLVHAHWSYEYAWAALDSGIPTVVSVRDWAPDILRLMKDKLYRTLRLMMNWYVLSRARYVTANSPHIQKKLENKLRRRIPLLPNSLPDEYYSGREVEAQDLHFPLYICVGNGFNPLKNEKTLLHAFAEVKKHQPSARLAMIGANMGPGEAAQKWARTMDLEQGVDFRGKVSHKDLFMLMDQSTALVHPSREESFGNVLLEAMSRGLPCIGGENSGAVPWVLDGGKAGVLVDINQSEAIARAMLKLTTEPGTWAHFSNAGYTFSWANFRNSVVSARHLEYYKEVLEAEQTRQSL